MKPDCGYGCGTTLCTCPPYVPGRIKTHLSEHKPTYSVLSSVVLADAASGVWYALDQHIPVTSGLCYALGVITTSGSSVEAGVGGHARLITALTQLLLIPLAGVVLSFLNSAITAMAVKKHVDASEARIKAHTERRIKHHLGIEQEMHCLPV